MATSIRIKSPQLYRLSYRPDGSISRFDVGGVPTLSPSSLREMGGNYTKPGGFAPGYFEDEQDAAAVALELATEAAK